MPFIVITRQVEPGDWRGWEWTAGEELTGALDRHGFAPVAVLRTMTLRRRAGRERRAGAT